MPNRQLYGKSLSITYLRFVNVNSCRCDSPFNLGSVEGFDAIQQSPLRVACIYLDIFLAVREKGSNLG